MKLKIILDIIMTLIMLCLINSNLTGVALHEILGIIIFFLFFFHKLLNFKWIKAVTGNLFKKSANTKTKWMYAIDLLLLILATLNVATGILISTFVLTEIEATDIYATSQLHHILAYLLGITLIVHIGFHWAYLRNSLKLTKNGLGEKIVLGALATIFAITLLESNTLKKYWIPRQEPDSAYPAELQATDPPDPTEGKKPDPTKPQNPTEGKKPDPTQSQDSTEGDTEPQESQQPTESPETAPTEDHLEDDESLPIQPSTAPDIPTLEEYLSKIVCTGCGRRCLLTNPACSRGRDKQQNAVQEYNQTYDANESYSSGNSRPRH